MSLPFIQTTEGYFYAVNSNKPWLDAQAACQGLGYNLATLDTQEVGTFMLYQSSTCANLIILSEQFIHKKCEINNVNHSVSKGSVNQC